MVKRLPAPDLDDIRKAFTYLESGKLINNYSRSHSKVGQPAGKYDSQGYLSGNFKGVTYKIHHLVYYHQTGIWANMLDHINGIRTDNRLSNLREATSTDNNRNHKMRCTNTSGVTGVSFSKKYKVWSAGVFDKGKKIHLGQFKVFEDAVKVRKKAELELGYYTNNGKQRN